MESDQGTLLHRLLLARGLQTPEARQHYLNPSLDQLHDPFALPDMAVACSLLIEAIQAKESIAIHGDYDVDGLTATALMVRFVRTQGIEPMVLIPDRFSEGYGLTDTDGTAAN